MMNNYYIYIHINKINGKVYVGQTCKKPSERWQNGAGYTKQVFGKAIEKYGWENFEHIILHKNLSFEEANQKEQEYIAYFDSTNSKKGYNQTTGGATNFQLSKETKLKISQAWTEERRKKLIERNKTYFQEHPDKQKAQKELMIQLNKTIDRTKQNNPMYGRDRTGKNAGNKKQVRCIETQQIFETVTEASKWCQDGKTTLRSHIAEQIQGKRKSCGKHPVTGEPLHWEYVFNKGEQNNEN